MVLLHYRISRTSLISADILFLGLSLLSIVLHNVVYALTQIEEPFFFLLALLSFGIFLGVFIHIVIRRFSQ